MWACQRRVASRSDTELSECRRYLSSASLESFDGFGTRPGTFFRSDFSPLPFLTSNAKGAGAKSQTARML
jgi:hypothetical protein